MVGHWYQHPQTNQRQGYLKIIRNQPPCCLAHIPEREGQKETQIAKCITNQIEYFTAGDVIN